ncbi:MAG: PilX N-terminal domain-containing pilus assembly protein [Methyloversatilis sp.]|uniref:pilus assembly PilX family protein n=1 Tax=Methyloversatilis sp. TaxID=2569862 RepID=UPI00273560A2|nr:PilX N-terminal domain-containing pilus assembly protein [Methyloversatilis sp.]MDP2868134.1 PilX N-terminal domain-containing pilus assembly protein [Methyloversatilis sp.]MDP3287633.1 PilX N-terminal domain-containing pilus assembly protein [Methyloversatilis sp.]
MSARQLNLRSQRGATLLVALVMLIVMTLLGLASIRGTSMQEKMGANMYDRSLAFQAVESALREAEASITVTTTVTNSNGLYCRPGGTPPLCAIAAPPPPSGGGGGGGSEESTPVTPAYAERWNDSATQWRQATTWWGQIDSAMKARLSDASNTPPEFIIEYMGEFEDGTGCGRRGSTACRGPRYRITARMPPVEGRPNVALQTTYRP